MNQPEPPPIRVRKATIADKEQILRLLERASGRPREPLLWDWLFLNNSATSDLYCYVAESDGVIVGQQAAMPVRLTHAGKELAGILSLHSATDPAFQGRGIFTKLATKLQTTAASGRPVLFGFPNPASAPIFYNKLGWVELNPFPVFARPLGNIRRPAKARRPWLAAPARIADALAFGGLVPAWGAKRRTELTGARAVPLEGFGPWADRLWTELRPQLGTCAVRDARFLQWRFCESPFQYRLYGLDRGEGPVGLAVVRCRPWKGGTMADLMELMVSPGDTAGADLLLATAILDAWAEGAIALRAFVSPRHPHRAAFRKAGFFRLTAKMRAIYSFGVCILDGSMVIPNELMHIEDWYISGADLDFV
jgi:GNAT superfamily N-acetyltransferase